MRPIFTVTVFIDNKRQPAIRATRHGIDPVEIWAAAGYLTQTLGVVIASLMGNRPAPHLAGPNGEPLVAKTGGEPETLETPGKVD
jgi:hypothetical protein